MLRDIEDPVTLAPLLAPILHFHPDEGQHCCFPSDAEVVFANYGSDWTRFRKELSPTILEKDAPCYFEFWHEPNMLQFKFWFWYNYNSFPEAPLGLGQHIGDWEHVEIRLYQLDDNQPATIWLLSNHHEARLCSQPNNLTVGRLTPEAPTLSEMQIHVWVALGSHANYPSADSKPKCYLRLWCDKIADGGPLWDTKDSLKSLDDTNFALYEGRWGNKKAPRSPRSIYNSRTRNAPLTRPIDASASR